MARPRPTNFATEISARAIKYPDDLGAMDGGAATGHYIIFKSYSTGFYSGAPNAPSANKEIALYLPASALNTSLSTKYETMQGFETTISNLGKQRLNTESGEDDIKQISSAASKAIAEAATDKQALVAGAFSALQKTVLNKGDIGKATLAGLGVAANPYLTVFFKGIGDFRTPKFSFDMIARNQNESITINEIVKSFQVSMLPGKISASGHSYFLKSPDVFRVEVYFNNQKVDIFKYQKMVLTNLSVDYAGQGIPLFFKDKGEPFNVKLELSFQETAVLTKDIFEGTIQGSG